MHDTVVIIMTGIALKKASLQMLSMKKIIQALSLASVSFLGSAAISGPLYLNVENNGSWNQEDFTGSTTDLHVGLEGNIGNLEAFAQVGPMLDNPDDENGETHLSGKFGGSIPASSNLDIYGEFAFVLQDENAYSSKLGAKYSF